EKALAAANLVLEAPAPPAWIFFTKAVALQSLKRPQESLVAVEEGLHRTPEAESAYGLGLKGQCLEALGRTSESEEALRHSVRLNPNLNWVSRTLSRTLGAKADALITSGQLPEAITCLEQAAEFDQGSDWIHEKLAEVFERQGQHEKALHELNQAIARNEKSATAHASRGFVLHSMGDRKRAEVDLERAIGLDPNLAWAHAELAALRREQERPEEALAAINRALDLAPDYGAALEIKAQIFIGIGENEAALKLMSRAPQSNASFHFWKGLALDNLSRFEEAGECYRAALGLDPEDVWSMRGLADIRLLKGEVEEGRKLFEQIIEKLSSRPRGPYEVGLCGWCHYGCGRLAPAIPL